MNDSSVRELARRAGIAVQWTDHANKRRRVPLDSIRRILAALQLPCGTADEIADSQRALDNATLPPLITATAGQAVDLPWRMADLPRRVHLVHEDGSATEIPVSASAQGIRLPGLRVIGYHTAEIGRRRITLAVAPARCISIADVAAGERVAGLTVQTYGLSRPGDCGIGDTSGVTALAKVAGRLGLEMLALSPAHALFAADPDHFSPYSPSNRLFYNPLFADAASVLGEERIVRARIASGLGLSAREGEALSLIDWKASTRAKMTVLRGLFEDFAATDLASNPPTDLAIDFIKFCAERGSALEEHALFEALHKARLQTDPEASNWRDWPASWRDPRSPAIRDFSEKNQHAILFRCFLQWVADRSFATAQREAKRAGMRIGLIADLAVGMTSAGSYAWAHQDHMLGGLQIGAPPDSFNANGQNWGLSSFSPRALSERGFEPFIATLRACMRHAGGLRVDHVMGLTRLWVIPEGAKANEGAYITYPVDDLFRLTALESYRHRAIVIGEDLGTVPLHFRERLARTGIYGMRVLWFERDKKGFVPPQDWSDAAAAMTSTHDLPTVAGWWRGTDLEARASRGLLNDPHAKRAARNAEREALWSAFKSAKIAGGGRPSAGEASRVVDAAVAFIAKTPSRLALLPLEDAIAAERQPNMPGTIDQYPNWRHRYGGDAAALLDDPDVRRRIETLVGRGAS
jgi:4-alpha-glucanotransferase